MSRHIQATRAAENDIREITEYIAGFNLAAADLFEQELRQTFERISENPEIGMLVPRHSQPIRFARVSQRFRRYLIFYLQDNDNLLVIRILHSARQRRKLLIVN